MAVRERSVTISENIQYLYPFYFVQILWCLLLVRETSKIKQNGHSDGDLFDQGKQVMFVLSETELTVSTNGNESKTNEK